MLLVPTFVAPSPIAGFGLYAAEPIAAGTVWWKFVEGFDKVLSPAEVEALPPLAQQHVTTYAYLWKGYWIHCADHAIFTNHSDHPNSYGVYPNADVFGWSVAKRDIAKGEEITEDYRTFCERRHPDERRRHLSDGQGAAASAGISARRPRVRGAALPGRVYREQSMGARLIAVIRRHGLCYLPHGWRAP